MAFRREPCADCSQPTRRRTIDGSALCEECQFQREAAQETVIECPAHGHRMVKESYEGVVIDRCPDGCVFLDLHELENLREIAGAEASSQFTTGLVIGIAAG